MRLYTIHAQHGYSCTYPQHWSACPMPLMDNQPATHENAASNSDGDMWRCNPHVLRLQESHPSCLNSKFFLVKSNVLFNMLKTPWLRGEFSGFPMVRAEKNAQWVVRTSARVPGPWPGRERVPTWPTPAVGLVWRFHGIKTQRVYDVYEVPS